MPGRRITDASVKFEWLTERERAQLSYLTLEAEVFRRIYKDIMSKRQRLLTLANNRRVYKRTPRNRNKQRHA